MTELTTSEYKNFMYNKDNQYNCAECPENNDMDGKLPCGQQNCWVCIHSSRCSEEP